MKKLIYTLVLFCLAFTAEAKKGQPETWVGFSQTMYGPIKTSVSGLPPVRMGFPSFSYASSIEQRFSLHHKLTFSLQYALAYFHLNMNRLQETMAKNAHMKEVSAGVGMNAIYQFRKDACVITGFSLNKPVYSCFRGEVKSEVPGQSTALTQQRFDIKDIRSWNPSFNIGFEKQFTLFNRNLRYSLQYQIGFMHGRDLPYGAGQINRGYMQGITLGLKYKL